MAYVRWTPAAAADLEEIHDYLVENYPHLTPLLPSSTKNIRSLKNNPLPGRPGREEGTRELVFAPLPYIATYRVKEQTIEVLHIHHTSRHHS